MCYYTQHFLHTYLSFFFIFCWFFHMPFVYMAKPLGTKSFQIFQIFLTVWIYFRRMHVIFLSLGIESVLPVFSFYNYYCNPSGKLNYLMSLVTLLSLLKLKGNNIKYILLCVWYSWALAKPFKIFVNFSSTLWPHILLDIRCSPRYCYKSCHYSSLLSSNIYKLRYM